MCIRDSFMAERGFRVIAADLPEQAAWIRGRAEVGKLAGVLESGELAAGRLQVDLVVSTYVLNIIPDGEEKERYLRNAAINLREEGYLLVEARCRQESTVCGSGCSHFHKCPSCIKTYSHDELDQLLRPYGFRRISHYYRRHAVVAVYQLCNA